MKRYFLFLLTALSLTGKVSADEGMWLPVLLQSMNEKDMQARGLKLSAEDIYSINHGSMKDAIVLFGRGCTGEIVSNQGLLLTNHHCGYGQIANHSTVDNDLLSNGFWALNKEDELANIGLTVSILVRMEDVTTKVQEVLKDGMTEAQRAEAIEKVSQKIEAQASENGTYKTSVEPFYYGNEFYLMVYEVFEDVRLVGAPPSMIGKFGGDTDNWMWPRHTGDFSMFRIYADKNNKPAKYSKDNVPYKPRYVLPISLGGVKENDFTFVFGFPGTTRHYTTSYGVHYDTEIENPLAIDMRRKKMDVIDKYSKSNDTVRLQYANKYQGIANYWKKMIGESQGIERNKGVEKRRTEEQQFMEWAEKNKRSDATGLMNEFDKNYQHNAMYGLAYTCFFEGIYGVELLKYIYSYSELVNTCKNDPENAGISKLKEKLLGNIDAFYQKINLKVEEDMSATMMEYIGKGFPTEWLPDYFFKLRERFAGNYTKTNHFMFVESVFTKPAKLKSLIAQGKTKKIAALVNDPLYAYVLAFYNNYFEKVQPVQSKLDAKMDSLYRVYVKIQREAFPEKRFWPDANSTLRVAYGNVKSYKAADAVNYKYYTTFDGIFEKAANASVEDYQVNEKMRELYAQKNYGRYADADGTLHTAFIATNHTTGGNSGSPVFNAKGQLIGINFDRVWEGTMSDLMFDPDFCRNVSLDIRYCLFVIDKYAGAGKLIEEMNIVP